MGPWDRDNPELMEYYRGLGDGRRAAEIENCSEDIWAKRALKPVKDNGDRFSNMVPDRYNPYNVGYGDGHLMFRNKKL